MSALKIHQLPTDDVMASLNSGPAGLRQDEARRRLHEFGPNRVEEIKPERLGWRFLKEFTHFFSLILWLAAGLAFMAEINDPGKGMATLGGAILGVILVNVLFFFWPAYPEKYALSLVRSRRGGLPDFQE